MCDQPPTGFSADSSSTRWAAASSQSSGLAASGSGIFSLDNTRETNSYGENICRPATTNLVEDRGNKSQISFKQIPADLSSQSLGIESAGSSISAGGLTGGVKESSRLPWFTSVWSIEISNVLSGRTWPGVRWGNQVIRCTTRS